MGWNTSYGLVTMIFLILTVANGLKKCMNLSGVRIASITQVALMDTAIDGFAGQEGMSSFVLTEKGKSMERKLIKQLVRCKDCIHGELEPWNKSNHNYKCLNSEYEGCYDYHEGDWFCADGRAVKWDG